jgi:hypothetical protein
MRSTLNVNEHSATGRLLKLLNDAWPKTVTVQPVKIGLIGDDGALAFLKAVQDLGDDGLIGYEALLRDARGPRILDASITTRGRTLFSQRDFGLKREQTANPLSA